MHGLKNMLLQEKKHLEDILSKAKVELSDAPEGHLRISNDKKKPRYYHSTDDRPL